MRSTIAQQYLASGASQAEAKGIIYGALLVGIFTVIVALVALRAIDETYGKDLDFEET